MTDQTQEQIQNMDFETAFAALQENVDRLENEDLPLEKALEGFERGQALAKRCAHLLDQAELRVRTLATDDPASAETES